VMEVTPPAGLTLASNWPRPLYVKRETLQAEVLAHVDKKAKLYTDNAPAYDGLKARFVHEVVDHIQTYVRGQVHTNGIENFWSLGDRFGHRASYQFGQMVFVVATILCFFARSLPFLVLVRGFQALGAAAAAIWSQGPNGQYRLEYQMNRAVVQELSSEADGTDYAARLARCHHEHQPRRDAQAVGRKPVPVRERQVGSRTMDRRR